jgi:ParB family chromosome partitioning protein
MTQPKGGLGRGLAALLPGRDAAAGAAGGAAAPGGPGAAAPGAPGGEGSERQGGDAWQGEQGAQGARPAELRHLGIDEIRPNPRQPRREFDEGALRELAASIASVGLLQPVVVRPVFGGYELVAGERRWRASRLAGLAQIPAIVRQTGDDSLLRDALVENLQREDLNPLEEAAAFRQLVDDFGATHEEVAARVGKSRAAVTNALRLLALAPQVQQRITSGSLSAAHGRAVAALADHGAQTRAAERVSASSLSVRATEEMVRQMAGADPAALSERAAATRAGAAAAAGPGAGAFGASEKPPGISEAEVLLSDILATRVTVQGGRGRGKIVIEYADFDDLDRIVRAIEGSR